MIIDVSGVQLRFGTGTSVGGPAGTVGQTLLYSGVATVGGQVIDAVVSVGALSAATITTFDSPTAPYNTAATPTAIGSIDFLQPNLNISAAGGAATLVVTFIAAGTYGLPLTPAGQALTLRNLAVNVYDVDGASAQGREFATFSGAGGSIVNAAGSLRVTSAADGTTTFTNLVGGGVNAQPGVTAGDAVRGQVMFDEVSSFSVTLGNTAAAGAAHFALNFGPGPAFSAPVQRDLVIGGAAGPGGFVTTEAGGSATFTMALTAAPTADVTVTIGGDRPAEGVLSVASLVFTAANWSVAQSVTISGIDDLVADGAVSYSLLARATSADAAYNGVGAIVDVTNLDDDAPGLPNLGALDITAATDTAADDDVTASGNPVLTVAAGAGLSFSVAGADGVALSPGQFAVELLDGRYTIRLLDADPVAPGNQPFGTFLGNVPTGNAAGAVDGRYVVSATDLYGNVAVVGSISIDTTAPTARLSDIDISRDVGDPTDFITTEQVQRITATLSEALGDGEILLGSLDGGASWVDVTPFVAGTRLAWSGAELVEGVNEMRFRVQDQAGNDGEVAAQGYELFRGGPQVTLSRFTVDGQREWLMPNLDTNSPAEYVWFGTAASEAVVTSDADEFIALGAGDDAVDAGGGDDIIDGGIGSNFLTGGAGQDSFFVDGRGASVSGTWSTITDWVLGEDVVLWGWRDGVSNLVWVDEDGVAGFRGVTLHVDIDGNNLVDTSITWSGRSRADLPELVVANIQELGLLWWT